MELQQGKKLLVTMAQAGRGMAWLPESLITDQLASGDLVAAGGPEWQSTSSGQSSASRKPQSRSGSMSRKRPLVHVQPLKSASFRGKCCGMPGALGTNRD